MARTAQPKSFWRSMKRWIELDALNARPGRVAEMRIFGGFDVKEIAQALGVTTRTVDRDWQLAKAWLHLQLRGAISAGA